MKKKSLKRCLKKRMILLLGFLMMTGVAVAQQLQVQGKVTDATGEGLIGASVLVKGTTSGVITDIDGNYVRGVKRNAINRVVRKNDNDFDN